MPFAGKFKKVDQVSYLAALDLLASGRFKLIENELNISPLSKAAIRFHPSEALSLSAISASADVSREETVYILKQIFSAFVTLAK